MRILFLSQLVPYPTDAGPKKRSYFVLRYLAQAGHTVDLLAFSRSEDADDAIEHLGQFCASMRFIPMQRSTFKDASHWVRSMLNGQPFLVQRDAVRAMYDAVDQQLDSQTYDAVHADQLWMAQYALHAGRRERRLILVLDQHNAVYLVPLRLAENSSNAVKRALLRQEAGRLGAYEVRVCNDFDHVVWVTAEDRSAVQDLPLSHPTDKAMAGPVIPICIDTAEQSIISRSKMVHRVTFLGGLHWPPNADGLLWFSEYVWPLIRAEDQDAVFTVIGKNPPDALKELVIPGARIEVCGYVRDLRELLAETAVFVAPLHAGGGMRVKIIDAWAWGLPVVSTTIGAEGLDYCNGEDLLIADSVEDFAAKTLRLLQDRSFADSIAASARNRVESQYDWKRIYPAWDEIYPPNTRTG